MEPIYERIDPNLGSSFYMIKYEGDEVCNAPFWHVHPEYEIVYVKNGSGTRHVGNHLSRYDDGDLVLIGPNLPHSSFGNMTHPNNIEVVVQIKPELFTDRLVDLQEFRAIKQLLKRAEQGISFYGSTKDSMGEKLLALFNLQPFERLLHLMSLLDVLASSNEYNLLHAHGQALEVLGNDYQRINKVYDYVNTHFQSEIRIEQMAALVSLTPQSFCRFFKKTTGKTFVHFLNEFRIRRACQLLSDERISLSAASYQCGFNNLSHFSRSFKSVVGVAPSTYRSMHRSAIAIG
ncbi:MAG: AraC family transcriptional regulator [Bacteroidota bacterium]